MRWDLLSWVLQGNQRMAVIQAMICPMTPTLIHRRCKAHYLPKSCVNSTSAVLQKFLKLGLAKRHKRKNNKSQEYELTRAGMEIRTLILKIMTLPATAAQVQKKAKESGKEITFNNVSDIMSEFLEVGLAVCLNPEKDHGRIYKLTSEGEEISKILLKVFQ